MYSEWTSLFTFGLGVTTMLVGSGWISAWWFSKKFSEIHDAIDGKIDKLERSVIQKLEYHERHDDARFSEINNAIWEIKLRNAEHDKQNGRISNSGN